MRAPPPRPPARRRAPRQPGPPSGSPTRARPVRTERGHRRGVHLHAGEVGQRVQRVDPARGHRASRPRARRGSARSSTVEGAHRRAPQRREVGAHAEGLPQVPRQRADVGAAGAAHAQPHLRGLERITLNSCTVTGRGSSATSSPRRARRWAASPPTFLALNLGGTCRMSPRSPAERLLQRPRLTSRHASDSRPPLRPGPPCRWPRPGAPSPRSVLSIPVRNSARRVAPPDAQEQQPGRERVERPGVADAALPQRPARRRHHVVGGGPLRLVHGKDAVPRLMRRALVRRVSSLARAPVVASSRGKHLGEDALDALRLLQRRSSWKRSSGMRRTCSVRPRSLRR